MADQSLSNRNIAFLFTDGVEEIEFTAPRDFVQERGAATVVLSNKEKGEAIQGFKHLTPDESFRAGMHVREARVEDFDALVIPGGVANPDLMRLNDEAVNFVRDFAASGKPLAVICHGPWLLVEAGVAKGRRLASWPSLETDINNAGGQWRDEPLVVDANLITSRKPDDLPRFCEGLLEALTS